MPATTALLQATVNKSVDIILALLLLVIGVLGAQVGARLSSKMKGEYLRVLLALIVLGVAVRLALDLTLPPSDVFSLGGGDN